MTLLANIGNGLRKFDTMKTVEGDETIRARSSCTLPHFDENALRFATHGVPAQGICSRVGAIVHRSPLTRETIATLAIVHRIPPLAPPHQSPSQKEGKVWMKRFRAWSSVRTSSALPHWDDDIAASSCLKWVQQSSSNFFAPSKTTSLEFESTAGPVRLGL